LNRKQSLTTSVPLAIFFAILAATIACGRSQHNRFDRDPSTLLAELSELHSDEFCSGSSQAKASPEASPKPKAAHAGFWARLFGAQKQDAKPHTEQAPQASAPPTADADSISDHEHFATHHEGDLAVAVGGGCVFRSLEDVWASVLNHTQFKWDESKVVRVRENRVPVPGQAIAYDLFYTGRINYQMYWVHGLRKGTLDHPEQLVISYQLSKPASVVVMGFEKEVMHQWEGQIVLTRISPKVTSAMIVNRFNIMTQKEDDSKGTAEDLLRHLRDTPAMKDELKKLNAI
jgi:hypothetical protein